MCARMCAHAYLGISHGEAYQCRVVGPRTWPHGTYVKVVVSIAVPDLPQCQDSRGLPRLTSRKYPNFSQNPHPKRSTSAKNPCPPNDVPERFLRRPMTHTFLKSPCQLPECTPRYTVYRSSLSSTSHHACVTVPSCRQNMHGWCGGAVLAGGKIYAWGLRV